MRLHNWVGALGMLVFGWYVISDLVFDEDNIKSLGGNYYTSSYDSGTALRWYRNPEEPYGEPLLDQVYDIKRNSRYLVARAGTNFYYIFPLHAASCQDAKKQQLGPFTQAELKMKLLQVSKDTVLHEVGAF
jgi:hypothetical protein